MASRFEAFVSFGLLLLIKYSYPEGALLLAKALLVIYETKRCKNNNIETPMA